MQAPSREPDETSAPSLVPTHAITNADIDPALLGQGGSQHVENVPDAGPSRGTLPNLTRNPVITSDNLALHEASKFMVTGKRDRVRRKLN
jgi:hypothetical protein